MSRLLVVLLFLVASPAAAQPDIEDLRRDYQALAAHPPAGLAPGVLTSIEYNVENADRIERRWPEHAASWRTRAARFIRAARDGRDPFPEQRGQIVNRGYHSRISTVLQAYAIYLPPDYDPSRSWPLLIMLHGGSSNGNLFLGVVLGNNMDWDLYPTYLWNDFVPRWSPEFIVVAPDGFGQVLWRWEGEQDILDVIEDVKQHYNVVPDRVHLGGLSNGGVGSYAVGMRQAWRFASVHAMAGAPSWHQYVGGSPQPEEVLAIRMFSAMHLVENMRNTNFRAYHGVDDGGPMRPAFVRTFQGVLRDHGLPDIVTWYSDLGHDVLYRVHRGERIYDRLDPIRRDPRPHEVTCVTGDFRARRQHWIEVTRRDRYPQLVTVKGHVQGSTLTIESEEDVLALTLHVRDVPFDGDDVRVVVDGTEVYHGPRAPLGHAISVARSIGAAGQAPGAWHMGFPDEPEGTLVKRPGVSGPLTDAYYDRCIHVFGTQNAANTEALRRAARRGSEGWPVWLWNHVQQVVADTDVTDAMMRDACLVLYGTHGDNAVLERIAAQLPIKLEADAVVVGTQRYTGDDVGTRFIYPNPLAPDRYVVVQGGITTQAVQNGHNLPDFLPDFVVYDRTTTRTRARLVAGSRRPRAMDYFDHHWQLPAETQGAGGDPEQAHSKQEEPSDAGADATLLPIPPAPPRPRAPRNDEEWGVPEADPAGAAAREIMRRVEVFTNYRAEIPGATWRTERASIWRVQPQNDCLDALARTGVRARLRPEHPTPVPTPVEILEPVDGVWFREMHEDRSIVISCEMALRLPQLVEILKRHDVEGVDVMSAYRDHPFPSFHTFGLALDLARFWTDRGWLSVLRDFEATPDRETCDGVHPSGRRGRVMQSIACDLYRSRNFSSVLTPNYNEGHRDHFHVDIRPYDPRLFLR